MEPREATTDAESTLERGERLLARGGTRSRLLALNGIVLAAFGTVMFVEPGDGAVALLALVAAFAIVGGSLDIALASSSGAWPAS